MSERQPVAGGLGKLVAALALAALVATVSACGNASPSAPVRLGVANGTTLAVSLFVNGTLVGIFPGEAPSPTINPGALPALPWHVEARSPTGRVLTSMTVKPGDVTATVGPQGELEQSGILGRVDLSCGRLTIWAGDTIPSGPPPPSSPGTPGDCAP